MLLGVTLLVVSTHKWRRRHDYTDRPITPKAVTRQLEDLSPRKASVLGVLIQPRTLTIAAAVVVARDRTGFISYLGGLSVSRSLSTAALIALFLYYLRRPDDASSDFGILSARIEKPARPSSPMLGVLGGLYLLFDAIRGLIAS